MEIDFQIHQKKRFVHMALAGDMDYEHMHGLLNQIVSLGVLDFQKIVDARAMRPRFGAYDIQMLRVRLMPLTRTVRIGPAAVVVGSEETFALFQMFEIIMKNVWAAHPCHTLEEAAAWLENQRPWNPDVCQAA